MGTRKKKDRRNASRAKARSFESSGDSVRLPDGTEVPVMNPVGESEDAGYMRVDDPSAPMLVRFLSESAVEFGKGYMRDNPDAGTVVAGAHAFPANPKHLRKIRYTGICLRDREAHELVIPLPWVAVSSGLICDQRYSDAIEPGMLERFREDVLEAVQSQAPVEAFCRLAEDPLRYLREVA